MSDVIEFEPPTQDDVRVDLRALFNAEIRTTLEALLEEEVRDLLGAARWARVGRRDHRNGTYLRGLMTSMGHIGIIVRMINLAVEWEVMPPIQRRNRKLKLPELDLTFLDPEEVPRFLRATPREWLPMMTVALKTGLRLGELLALRWKDVDLVAGQLMVRRSLWRDIEGPTEEREEARRSAQPRHDRDSRSTAHSMVR